MSDAGLFVVFGDTLHLVRPNGRSLCGAKWLVFVLGIPLTTARWALDEASMCRRCKRAYERQNREAVKVTTE